MKASDSASGAQKKNDAYATAELAFVDRRDAVASGDGGTRKQLECSRKNRCCCKNGIVLEIK